jgi:Zn-finger nucleic acid-binding protein
VQSGNGESGRSGQMVCPRCGADLRTVERQGIEIERCPNCRGVWLDRGELEKLVALGATHDDQAAYERPAGADDGEPDPADRLATRRSFFAELFDTE